MYTVYIVLSRNSWRAGVVGLSRQRASSKHPTRPPPFQSLSRHLLVPRFTEHPSTAVALFFARAPKGEFRAAGYGHVLPVCKSGRKNSGVDCWLGGFVNRGVGEGGGFRGLGGGARDAARYLNAGTTLAFPSVKAARPIDAKCRIGGRGENRKDEKRGQSAHGLPLSEAVFCGGTFLRSSALICRSLVISTRERMSE